MLGLGKPASIAAGVVFGAAAVKGFFDQVAPKTIDNAMDIAFGDPQADRAVLGTDLTPSMMYMASGLPGSSSIGRALNLGRVGINTGGRTAAVLGMGGAAVGGIGGVYAGAKLGGIKGAIAGGVAGLIGGGIAGTGLGITPALRVARNNSQIMSESPFYNQSTLTAERLNASGNIVLRNA